MTFMCTSTYFETSKSRVPKSFLIYDELQYRGRIYAPEYVTRNQEIYSLKDKVFLLLICNESFRSFDKDVECYVLMSILYGL